ncbi:MAG: hypothetical protein H7A24_00770 [Leptospiraceae bacterium]|nr:hypothetical protein [Leptospiraceae bacterium]MCP5510383.1 hypothetical protein [Leptospiraceae bacterium]
MKFLKQILIIFAYLLFLIVSTDCASITYKVKKKENINRLSSYIPKNDTNFYFFFGFFPLQKKIPLETFCVPDEMIESSPYESKLALFETNYSGWNGLYNFLFLNLLGAKQITAYCKYELKELKKEKEIPTPKKK